jgi:threonine dehydratase
VTQTAAQPTRRHIALDDIRAAAARIAGRVHRTPMLSSRTAAAWVLERQGVRLGDGPPGDGVARLFLKAEHLQIAGSFKVRGASNRVLTLAPEDAARGLIGVSAGNHAQAVAYAGAAAGIPVTVVMPAGASKSKAAAARGYGAEVVLHGAHVGETFDRMERLRDARGLTFVHPFNDPQIIAGQGTVGLEIVEDLPALDVVVVGVGGGGLISGIASAVKQLRPEARVYGVEPIESNALSLAIAEGHPVPIQPQSIADGLGAPFAGEWTIDIASHNVDAILLVDERTIARGVRFALERMKQLLEPAGAAALGAVLASVVPIEDGEVVCVVASGGNVDLDQLSGIVELADDAEPPRYS